MAKIYFGTNQEIEWQRFVKCKEMLHILDDPKTRTATLDQVEGLVRKLILPPAFQLATMDWDNGDDRRALFDRLGAFQAVALLFPMPVREMLMSKYQEGALIEEEIVRIVGIPQVFVRLAMSDFWPAMHRVLC